MPIFEFGCVNCKTTVEKIVLAKVKVETVPMQIVERCKRCGATTRHARVVSKPAYVGLTPPGTSKKAAQMQSLRPPRDPNWKERVKKGLNPDGKPLTNMRALNSQEWEAQIETAFPDLEAQQEEVVGRIKHGEMGALKSYQDFVQAVTE